MNRVDQTRCHNGDIRGNCFRACIASLFDLPLEKVPAFEDAKESHEWHDMTLNFIDEHGCEYWGVTQDWNSIGPEEIAGMGGYVIASGNSPRGDWKHAVLWKDGQLAHDPHPSREGLKGDPLEFFLIARKKPTPESEAAE
jgi:hypothetical protein